MIDEPPVGAWTPEAGPLQRPLSPASGRALAIGIGMLVLAAALLVLGVVNVHRLPELWLSYVVLGLAVVFFGALGGAVVVGYPRGRRATLTIDQDGVRATEITPQAWAWSEVEHVAVDVALRRAYVVTDPGPKSVRTRVAIAIVLRPTPEARAVRGVDAARIRIVAPAFSSGENVPIVRDIDAALRAYAGDRYGGVTEQLRRIL